MRNRRTNLMILAAVVAALSASVGLAEKDRAMQTFMQMKLDAAQGVLAGLTLENYHMALTNATTLRNMTPTNSSFGVTHVDYQRNITNFQASVDAVAEAARNRNLEQATEAYTKMARACVECHKDFRKEQFLKRQLYKQ